MRNSVLILAKNIKLDREHKNVLRYGQSEMLDLLQSTEHYVTSSNNFSFIRNINKIRTNFNYNVCLSSNYVAFSNPDYSDMYFFAWIDKVNYISNACTEIEVTIDTFTTWWNFITLQKCYVIREHPENDVYGANNLTESIAVDDYIAQSSYTLSAKANKICFLFSEARKSDSTVENPHYVSPWEAYNEIGGIPFIKGVPVTLWRVTASVNDVGVLMRYFNDYVVEGKANDLVGVFFYNDDKDNEIEISRPAQIGGYTPKYSKTLQYPYVKISFSNNAGSYNELKFENFNNNTAVFKKVSINNYKGQCICYPSGYKNIEVNTDCGLIIDNYPSIPMTVDSFATYLAQNSTTVALNSFASIAGTMTSVATGNPISAIAGAGGLINSLGNLLSAKSKPDSVVGASSGNLINMALDKFNYLIEIDTCKEDVAKMVDDYFDYYGYLVNTIKTPNVDSQGHNYVQIGNNSVAVYGENVPDNALVEINNCFTRGLTFWNNHDNIGKY